MTIILPIATEQEITVYAREHTGSDYVVTVTNEETNKSTTILSTVIYDDDGKIKITLSYDFQEGRFYMLEVTAEKLIYRGKLYATTQTGQYSVASYTKPTDNKNTFIVKQ